MSSDVGGGGGGGKLPTKVKVIVTKFVEADAEQFKSVVQRLTGKDSTAVVTVAAEPSGIEENLQPAAPPDGGGGGGARKRPVAAGEAEGSAAGLLPNSLDELFELLRD
ncbi:VQ motif-containing protein 10 [Canna indica]|uniref:VQ motif-containing protein 10 n=1 Tax=Canna indica TaxID=4628 RepID=A0AAQ3KG76_9LILI|nr:VQ motif-containing protein 10 [Canna indica]